MSIERCASIQSMDTLLNYTESNFVAHVFKDTEPYFTATQNINIYQINKCHIKTQYTRHSHVPLSVNTEYTFQVHPAPVTYSKCSTYLHTTV